MQPNHLAALEVSTNSAIQYSCYIMCILARRKTEPCYKYSNRQRIICIAHQTKNKNVCGVVEVNAVHLVLLPLTYI